jgi:hypothetical protein
MAQVIIRRPTTVNTYADMHVDVDRAQLALLLQEAIKMRGQGFWANADATVFAGTASYAVPASANVSQLAAQIIP